MCNKFITVIMQSLCGSHTSFYRRLQRKYTLHNNVSAEQFPQVKECENEFSHYDQPSKLSQTSLKASFGEVTKAE